VGGFLGIGGSSAKRDRSEQLKSFGELENIFNFALPNAQAGLTTGAATTKSGVEGLDSASAYWQKLLSGNRAAMTQAVAPETNAVLSQTDARRRQQARLGTARGGGVAGANQTAQDEAMAKIDNLLFGVRPKAAEEVGKLGVEKARIGLGESNLGANLLNIGEVSAANLGEISTTSRKLSADLNAQAVSNVTNAIDAALTFAFA
jgi:hypothetical protein